MKTLFAGTALLLVAGTVLAVSGHESIVLVGDAEGDEGEILSFSVFVDEVDASGLTYTWDFGDGTPGRSGVEETAVGHRFRDDGNYRVRVTVSGALSLEASMQVEVRGVAPIITVLSAEEDGQTVRFQGKAYDPGDDELTYIWDFGDGSPVQRGVDLVRPTHRYAQPGDYTVTLTVVDDDGLATVKVLGVGANPGFLGEVAGEVTAFRFAGESGKASLMNALPGSRALPIGDIPLFTGSAPMGGGVADLSDAFGICMINAGFWDDESKAHINFVMTPNSDSVFTPRTYVVGWDLPGNDRIPPDQLIVNALILEIEPSYEDTKAGAEEMRVFDLASGIRGIRDLVGAAVSGRLGRLFGGGGGQQAEIGPGRNYQLTSYAGYVRTTRITHERIHGEVDVVLRGAWMGREGSGEVVYVEVEGEFAWEMDEVARANLLRCGDRRFGIDTHTPWVEAENVEFSHPSVSLSLTLPYRRDSVNEQTFEVGWLDPGDGFHPIGGELFHDDDGLTIHFEPDEDLDDAVFYMARVRGGQTGIRSESGETLAEDYQWRFSTRPDMVIDFEQGQGEQASASPIRSRPVSRPGGPVAGATAPLAGPFRVRSPPDPFEEPASPASTALRDASPPRQVQKLCDRTPEDRWSATPIVDVLIYQTSCNTKLVSGKKALVRVYLNWTYPAGKKGVDEYTGVVSVTGSVNQSRTRTMKRQEDYSDEDRRSARNSVNFDWTPRSGGPTSVKAQVADATVGPGIVPMFEPASQVRAFQFMSKEVKLTVPVVFPKVGSWRDGVPSNDITRWAGPQGQLGDGFVFARHNLPVFEILPAPLKTPVDLPGWTQTWDYVCSSCEDWLARALVTHFTRDGAPRPHLIMAIVPGDFGGEWAGVTKRHFTDEEDNPPVRNRTPAVIFIKSFANTRTVAHELGHYFGLSHQASDAGGSRDPGIDGFRVEKPANKSFVEGNSEVQRDTAELWSLMRRGSDVTEEAVYFILNEQYRNLLQHLESNPVQLAWERSGEFQKGDGHAPAGVTGDGWAIDGGTTMFPSFRGSLARPEAPPWSMVAAKARPEAHVLVSGYVLPDVPQGHLDPLVVLEDHDGFRLPGNYRIRFNGPDGDLVREVSFDPEPPLQSEEHNPEAAFRAFRLIVPWVEGVASVQILDPTGRVLSERSAGMSTPRVTFLEQGGSIWRSGGSVRWEGNDPDGDDLFYTLSYRPDDHSDWRPVVSDFQETEVEPDPDWLPPGSDPRMRLTVSDGVRSATIESGRVEPRLAVAERRPGGLFPASTLVTVRVRFNAMLADNLPDDALRVRAPDGELVEGVLEVGSDGYTLEFLPTEELRAGATYDVEMSDAVSDASGTSAPGERWSFETEADTRPPEVMRTVPRDGSISIPRQGSVTVWFDERMDSVSVLEGVSVRDSSGRPAPITFRYLHGERAVMGTFTEPLRPRETYELVVGRTVKDLSGNPIADEVVRTFTSAGMGGPLRPPGG